MRSADIMARLKDLDVQLWAEDDQLRFSAPKGVMTDELIAEIRAHKDELLQLLERTERLRRAVTLCPVERSNSLPLSFSQERLWFLYQLFPESLAYNYTITNRLAGDLDLPALQQSLQALVDRHESLRTCFRRSTKSRCSGFSRNARYRSRRTISGTCRSPGVRPPPASSSKVSSCSPSISIGDP